jgi:hypothetical protein
MVHVVPRCFPRGPSDANAVDFIVASVCPKVARLKAYIEELFVEDLVALDLAYEFSIFTNFHSPGL